MVIEAQLKNHFYIYDESLSTSRFHYFTFKINKRKKVNFTSCFVSN